MSVLYLLSTGSYLRKIKDRLLIGRADGSHKSLPIQNVEQIVLNKGGKITPEAVYALLEHRIPIIYVVFLGDVVGVLGNLPCSLLRSLCQMQYFSQEPQQILLIRSILAVKLENQQSLLKSYAKSKYHDELLKLAKQIARYAKRISQTDLFGKSFWHNGQSAWPTSIIRHDTSILHSSLKVTADFPI